MENNRDAVDEMTGSQAPKQSKSIPWNNGRLQMFERKREFPDTPEGRRDYVEMYKSTEWNGQRARRDAPLSLNWYNPSDRLSDDEFEKYLERKYNPGLVRRFLRNVFG